MWFFYLLESYQTYLAMPDSSTSVKLVDDVVKKVNHVDNPIPLLLNTPLTRPQKLWPGLSRGSIGGILCKIGKWLMTHNSSKNNVRIYTIYIYIYVYNIYIYYNVYIYIYYTCISLDDYLSYKYTWVRVKIKGPAKRPSINRQKSLPHRNGENIGMTLGFFLFFGQS